MGFSHSLNEPMGHQKTARNEALSHVVIYIIIGHFVSGCDINDNEPPAAKTVDGQEGVCDSGGAENLLQVDEDGLRNGRIVLCQAEVLRQGIERNLLRQIIGRGETGAQPLQSS